MAPKNNMPQGPESVDEVAEGAAFPWSVKALASLLVVALLFWGLRAADEIVGTGWSLRAILFMTVTLAVIAFCYYWILRSRTAIDATSIRQSWLWPKEVALVDITQIKFIYVPYMRWLIAPRLIVRARGRGLFVFHAADDKVLQKFAHLSLGGAFVASSALPVAETSVPQPVPKG